VLFVGAVHFVYGPFLGFLWSLVRLFFPSPSGRKRNIVLVARIGLRAAARPRGGGIAASDH
jgi:hypothetical protein